MACIPGFNPTANWGLPLLLAILIRCHLSLIGFLLRNVVIKLNCSGSPWLKILSVGITKLAVESILYAVCILLDPLTLDTPGYPSRFTSNSNLRIKSKD